MIKQDSKSIKGLPEQYFTIPKGETVDSNTLGLALQRIDVMNELLIRNGSDPEMAEEIFFILEGMIYQAKELAGEVQ